MTITASTTANGLHLPRIESRIGNRLGRIAVPALALCAVILLLIRRMGWRVLMYGLLASLLGSLALAGALRVEGGWMRAKSAVDRGTRPGELRDPGERVLGEQHERQAGRKR